MMFDVTRLAVVVAHPDDETLGAGGTLARLAASPCAIQVIFTSDGESSRYDDEIELDNAIRAREAACSKALGTLGIDREPVFLRMPDHRLDTVPLLDIVQALESLLIPFEPEIVLTHHAGDLNIDHATASRAALTAARPDMPSLKGVYTFAVPSSTEWSFDAFSPSFAPNQYVDISQTFDKKMRAMADYGEELRPSPHPRSPDILKAIAMAHGSRAGLSMAEPFEQLWRRM